jgi:hypothetical protein
VKADSELQRDVLDELTWEPGLDATHIGVSVKDGVVTLTGHVPSYAERYAAERAAKRVHGVQAVANELEVRLPEGSRRGDEDIAAAAVNALQSNTRVPAATVAGAPVYLNPAYVVSLRPDPADPTRVTMVKLRDGESIRVQGDHREVADKLARTPP